MHTRIKTLILDFGGIIYDIDFQRAARSFEQLGIKKFDDLYSHAVQTGIFEQLERGELTDSEFYEALMPYFHGRNPEPRNIKKAWNSLLLGFKKERIELIRSLRKDFRITLLSNTNQIHYDQFSREFKDEFGSRLEDEFDHCTFSHRCGSRKPEDAVYRKALKAAQAAPENCLFIDDTPHNLPPAERAGIRTYLHKPGDEITEILPRILAEFNQ